MGLQLIRRLLLAAALLTALVLEWWTVNAVVALRMPPPEFRSGAEISLAGTDWTCLYQELVSVAQGRKSDPAWEARMTENQRFFVRSTLHMDPSTFLFFFRADESPIKELRERLQPGEKVLLQIGSGEQDRLVALLMDRPKGSGAPEALIYRYAGSDLSGWIVSLGLVVYVATDFSRRKKSPGEDPRLLGWQTFLGVALCSGFAWMLLARADPSSRIIDMSDPGSILGWLGLGLGLATLFSSARRIAAKRENGQASHVRPGFPMAPTSQNWSWKRLLPALSYAAALGILMGFLRMGNGFFPGLQGLTLGMVLGAVVGYFVMQDRGDSWKVSRFWQVVAAAVFVFMVFQVWGMDLSLRKGNALAWLGAILDGTAKELFFGYRRYQWGARSFQPGPMAWMFFNLLDLSFQVGMAFLIARVVNSMEKTEQKERTEDP